MLEKRLTRLLTEQAVDDASYLWLLREQAVTSPNYNRFEVTELDERLEGYLDFIKLANEFGWQACEENLSWKDAGEIFVGCVTAFGTNNPKIIDSVIDVGCQSLELSQGIVSALAWENGDKTEAIIHRLLNSMEPIQKRIAIGASGVLRKDIGQSLNENLTFESTDVRSRALKAVGELGRKDLLEACIGHIDNDDEDCRFWSAWSAALLGSLDAALPALQSVSLSDSKYSEKACDLTGRIMNVELAQDWLQELGNSQSKLRQAVIFAGAVGMPVLVSWLINIMTIPELARKAAESFVNITGADLIDFDLAGDEPAGFEVGPSENPEDEFVEMDADEDLPWPDVDKIAQWWANYKDHYAAHERYLCGQPINVESLNRIIDIGKQTHRHAAALELTLISPGKPLIEVRARSA
ncbi:MAG: hypothetical protein AMJ53_09395 [Gammaproteobacteria bacterium SG8_11]|nr:MAG: hypothetical protein AMJ53_09395 [Gammaproteobacteria bacterium SG8_11]